MQIPDDSLSSSFHHPNCFTSSSDTTEEVKDVEGVGMTLAVDDNRVGGYMCCPSPEPKFPPNREILDMAEVRRR